MQENISIDSIFREIYGDENVKPFSVKLPKPKPVNGYKVIIDADSNVQIFPAYITEFAEHKRHGVIPTPTDGLTFNCCVGDYYQHDAEVYYYEDDMSNKTIDMFNAHSDIITLREFNKFNKISKLNKTLHYIGYFNDKNILSSSIQTVLNENIEEYNKLIEKAKDKIQKYITFLNNA